MNDPVKRRDLSDGNIERVFPNGITEPIPQDHAITAPRPSWEMTPHELDAITMFAMGKSFLQEWQSGNKGDCLHIFQLSKQWTRYDARTNSWITINPTMVAQNCYLVEGRSGKMSVGYTSALIGAVLDMFVPFASRMRYRFEGEGQERKCTASAKLMGDDEPFEYTTPTLGRITPKNSPLWGIDPDRQLAYYARRSWARLYSPGALLGIYDVDELEGSTVHSNRHIGPDAAKDVTPGEKLMERLTTHAETNGGEPHKEGFGTAPAEAAGAPKAKAARATKGKAGERTGGLDAARAAHAEKKAKQAETISPKTGEVRKLPKNAAEYMEHVKAWLPDYPTEEEVRARWRAEMKLRNACHVTEEERTGIQIVLEQRIQDIRK